MQNVMVTRENLGPRAVARGVKSGRDCIAQSWTCSTPPKRRKTLRKSPPLRFHLGEDTDKSSSMSRFVPACLAQPRTFVPHS